DVLSYGLAISRKNKSGSMPTTRRNLKDLRQPHAPSRRFRYGSHSRTSTERRMKLSPGRDAAMSLRSNTLHTSRRCIPEQPALQDGLPSFRRLGETYGASRPVFARPPEKPAGNIRV